MERIIGIGVDQVEIQRVLDACRRERFVKKIYSEKEQQLLSMRKNTAATNFAGKEAVAKAFGTGFIGISPNEISILRQENGAPYVELAGRAKTLAGQLGISHMHISLSDSKTLAEAFVIAVGNEMED